jgi:hypothetical protein
MFGVFFHPKSVARQREVPELSVPMRAQAQADRQMLVCAPSVPDIEIETPAAVSSGKQGVKGWIAAYSAAIRSSGRD